MVVSEALLKGVNASTYIMLDAAIASEAYWPELQANSDEILAKYRPGDWNGYDSLAWSANWYTWFTNDVNDACGKIGWAGHFAPLLRRQGLDVYNFYSSGDEVFAENPETPGIATGVFHWPTLNLDKRANGWGREGILVMNEHGQQHVETPWLHSDIKDMAYYYVYPAFTNIVEKGVMK